MGSQENIVSEKGITLEQISSRIRSPLERLANEVQRSVQYYGKEFPYGNIEKVFICGGSSNLKNIDLFLNEYLNQEVIVFRPETVWDYGEKVDDFVFRKVNLDPGILSLANLVLASTKDFSHRIYLKDGIFSEVTLVYEKKRFKALPWTYPDYTEPEVIDFLNRARETMKGTEFDV